MPGAAAGSASSVRPARTARTSAATGSAGADGTVLAGGEGRVVSAGMARVWRWAPTVPGPAVQVPGVRPRTTVGRNGPRRAQMVERWDGPVGLVTGATHGHGPAARQ